MELQNLNELRYIIELENKRVDNVYYYVDAWPNPELSRCVENENHPINVYDSVYYSANLVDAKTYSDYSVARKDANLLPKALSSWTGKVIVISAKVFFKARLMG